MKAIKEGLTFDDVLLVPARSRVTPDMVRLDCELIKGIMLNVPLRAPLWIPLLSIDWP